MKLRRLRIENFRSFKDETVHFDDYTCIVGPNGSGKSAVLAALNVLFRNPDPHADVTTLQREDFHCKDTTEPVRITATFDTLSDEATADLGAYVRQGELVVSAIAAWNDGTQRAEVKQVGSRKVMKDFAQFFHDFDSNATAASLKATFAAVRTRYSDVKDEKTKDGMRSALREYEESHPESCELVESGDQFYGWSKGSNLLDKHLLWVYVPAVKDPVDEQDEAKDTALGKLLQRTIRAKVDFATKLSELKAEFSAKYREMLDAQQSALSESAESLQKRLIAWSHPGAKVDLIWNYDEQKSVTVASPLARAKVGEGEFLGDLNRSGHGLQRSFLVALLQELASSTPGSQPTLLLGLEEPELYQHPPQARFLASVLEELAGHSSQVVITTHSPYFVSGKGFESIRMTRKESSGASRVSHLNYDALSTILAQAVQEKAAAPSAIMAKVEQIMQPSQNELFFSTVPILVEGVEDVAFIAAHLRIAGLWDDFRKNGCHFVVCGGKSQMSRPLAIAVGLGIPAFAVFDGDSDEKSNIAGHEKNNGVLLRLLGYNGTPIAESDQWYERCVMWSTKIGSAIRNEVGAEPWALAEAGAKAKHGFEEGVDRKNALLIAATLEELANVGIRSSLLQQLCEAITNWAAKYSPSVGVAAEAPVS